MELKIYNPQADGFIKSIDWNFEELKTEITEKVSDYMNLVYSDDQIKIGKKDRADLNKFKKALDDKRKDIKKQVMDPYNTFEAQIKELIGIVDKAVNNIDQQIKGYEETQRQEKEKFCRELFKKHIGDLDRVIPYEAVFDPKWLNKTTTEKSITEQITAFRDKVDLELKAINSDSSKYVYEMKEEYLKGFDLSAAMAVKQRLEETEKKKAIYEAQEQQRRAEEEKRIAEEAQAVQTAGNDLVPVLNVNDSGETVVTYEEKPKKVIAVTFRVIANESQFEDLNKVIKSLKAIVGSQNVEMVNKEVL